MSNSYNEAEVLRKAGVENFSKFLEAQGQLAKRTHLEAAIKCFENAFKASFFEEINKVIPLTTGNAYFGSTCF